MPPSDRLQRLRLHPLSVAILSCITLTSGVVFAESTDVKTLDTVTVSDSVLANGNTLESAYAGGQVANAARIGVLGESNANDVPFNVVSYTSELIENQQAETVADVLENDASVQSGFGYGNYAEKFMIRGFELNGEDISFGGLYGVLPRQIVLTDIAERVELFKGSSAFANGVSPSGSGIGGAINIEPKRAAANQKTEVTADYASDGYVAGGLDTGTRFGSNEQFGVRINLKHGEGDTAIDNESRENSSVFVGLDHDSGKSRTSLDVGHQESVVDGGRSVVYAGSSLTEVPDAPDASTNYAPYWASTNLKTNFGMLRNEYDLAKNWTTYVGIGGNDTKESGQYSSPTVLNSQGDASIGRMYVPYWAKSIAGQAGVRGKVETNNVSHQLNMGYSGFFRKTGSAYEMDSYNQATNIYSPADLAYQPTVWSGGDRNDPEVRSRTRAHGISASDTLGFMEDQLLVTLGARYQKIELFNYDYSGSYSDGFSDHDITPVYGVVYKPVEHVSLYANHIEALQPGESAPVGTTNAGNNIGIKRSTQNEVGAKYDNNTLGAGISLFEIEQPNAYINTATNTYGYFGEQRNRGIELSVFGTPTDRVRLLSSATFIDSELTKTQDGLNQGNQAVGVAKYRFVTSGEWDIPNLQGWTASARVVHTGYQYLNAANTLELSPWTRLDLGVRYELPLEKQMLTIRANVENVTNENYWASATGGYLTQGDPMTAKLSASVTF